ncbi:MAG: hypothetical protein PHT62_12635 [Desulfotomaculaceae bacterium]|nr:hypothetical protein [Desulfotomaculaceae bacterium]
MERGGAIMAIRRNEMADLGAKYEKWARNPIMNPYFLFLVLILLLFAFKKD